MGSPVVLAQRDAGAARDPTQSSAGRRSRSSAISARSPRCCWPQSPKVRQPRCAGRRWGARRIYADRRSVRAFSMRVDDVFEIDARGTVATGASARGTVGGRQPCHRGCRRRRHPSDRGHRDRGVPQRVHTARAGDDVGVLFRACASHRSPAVNTCARP